MNMETTSPSPPCDTLSPSSIDSSQNTSTLSTNTSKNSCKHCRESHRKCDRTLPQCVQCTKRGLRCIYEPSKKRRSRAAMAEEAEQQSQHHQQQPVLHHSSSSSSSVSSSGYESFEQQAKMAKLSHPINNINTTTGATNTTAANHHYLPSATIMAPPFPPPSHHHNLSHHHHDHHQHSHHHHNHQQHPNHQYFQPQLLQPSYLSQQPQIQLQLSQPQPQQQQQQQVVPPPLAPPQAPPQAPSLQQMVSHPNFNLESLMKMSGQHQDASTTTSIVPNAQSTVSLPSPSTISGSAISAMLAPNSGSLNDVLNLCFQILPTEHRSSLTAQFLWSQSSNPPKNKNDENDGIISVNSDREAEEELDRKAGEAMWLASQAVLLQYLPSSDPHRFIDLDAEEMFFDKMCEKIFLCFQLIDRNNMSGVSGDSSCEPKLVRPASSSCVLPTGKGSGSGPYAHLMRKFTREQLLDAAQQMYRLSKEILLDPKVFPHISNHFKFAQSCSFLVFYLLSVGNEQSETHVFLKAVKVFMDRAKGIVEQNSKIVVMNEFSNGHITRSSSNGNISTSSVDSNEEAEYQCLVLDHMADGYLGLKVTLFNDTIAFNKVWIRKFIKLSLKALDARKTEAHFVQALSRHQAEALKKLKKLLSEINGTTLVHWNKFISTCREIRLSVKFHDKHPQTIWNFFMLSFEMYALQAVCVEDNGVMPSLLSTMQVNLANEISEILIGNVTLSMVAGSRLRLFLEFVTRVHIAHAEVLCRSISATKEEMEDALKYLRMDALIVDVIRGRHNNARCKELHKLLHQHMVRHTMTMGRQYDPNWQDQMALVISKVQMDQESKLLPSIDNKVNPVLSIQDSDFSDQGFLMELFDMDQDFLYLNDQYNN